MKPKHGYFDVFVKTCAKYPSRIAIRVYEDGKYKSYAYSELYGVCEYMVQNIQQVTCDKGIIGLITDRNAIIPSLIAACHKCSTTFMFIDPSQDVNAVMRDTKVGLIIHVQCSKQNTDLFAKSPDKKITVFGYEISMYKFQSKSQVSNLIQEYSFIAKTSGSTGDAKYIQVPLDCLQPNVNDLTKIFNITSQDVIYFSTPLTFDPSMVEILLACVNGATLLIAPEKADVLFPNSREPSVTFWQTTPSKFFQYSDADIKNKILGPESTLKVLALGGEPLYGIRRIKKLKDVANVTKIFTLYGVTEMSCWACVAELNLDTITDDEEIPLGNCLSETELFVENAKESNNIGNIVLVSKTRKCVVLNTRNTKEHSEALDTGDIGEIKEGTVYYRGRRDDVIKRFGNKVSLQNIEAIVLQNPDINSCSCIWLSDTGLLVVFYTSFTVNIQDLKDFLKLKLDDKQWPDKIMRLDSLPVSPHGKTSKLILAQMVSQPKLLPQIDVRTLFIEELSVILNKSFSYNEICRNDFFSIGGSSILAVLICNKLSQQHTDLGSQILPYLLNPKYSIKEIIDVILKEIDVVQKKPRKRKLTQTKTSSAVQSHISTSKNVNYEVVWSYNTGKCVDATPSLFEHEFKMYAVVGSHSGKIVVAGAESGEICGTVLVNSRVEASVVCCNILNHPYGIVGTYDGTIVCFRLQDCKLLWRTNIGCMIKSKGVVLNNEFYIASYDGNIRVIDVINGTIEDTLHIVDHGISADLILAQGKYLLVGTLSGVCACVDTTTNSVLWRIHLGSPVFASPALYNEDKYVVFAEVNAVLHCRNINSGKKVWEYTEAQGHIFSSIHFKKLTLGWKMIFGCHDNNVYCVVIRNSQPVLHWKTLLTSPVYSTPCSFIGEYIVAVSNNGVLCIVSSVKGDIITEYRLPSEVFSSPVVLNDNIYIGCRDDSFYCIKCSID